MPTFLHQKDHDKLRILVVEDSDFLREMFRRALRGEHAVYAAAGAKEGWRLYQEKEPDIIFVDIGLPDGNGHDLARKIKEYNPAAFVVMATASDFAEDREVADQNNADGYIAKPYNKQEINDYVDHCLFLNHRDSAQK